jgi:hypothetical protein
MTFPKAPSTCLTSCIEFDMTKAPIAAPPIIIISKGSAPTMMPNLPPAMV